MQNLIRTLLCATNMPCEKKTTTTLEVGGVSGRKSQAVQRFKDVVATDNKRQRECQCWSVFELHADHFDVLKKKKKTNIEHNRLLECQVQEDDSGEPRPSFWCCFDCCIVLHASVT